MSFRMADHDPAIQGTNTKPPQMPCAGMARPRRFSVIIDLRIYIRAEGLLHVHQVHCLFEARITCKYLHHEINRLGLGVYMCGLETVDQQNIFQPQQMTK